jgi:uncharacterized Fe-S cluster-containing radical SAM superfamily protein
MDIIERINLLQSIINDGNKRLCHKYRISKYYGGIATVDVVGCYLDCAFCWVPEYKRLPEMISSNFRSFDLLTPQKTADILINLATKNKLKSVRLSGGEPTLNKEHLIQTIELVTRNGFFYILETNGIYIDNDLVDALKKYKDNIFVYYSIKGTNPSNFKRLTTSDEKYWYIQLENLSKFVDGKFKIGINTMMNYVDKTDFLDFLEILYKKNIYLPLSIDTKETSMFPHVINRLKDRGISTDKAKLDKQYYIDILNKHFNEIFNLRDSMLVKLGIMDFVDFGKIVHQSK